MLMPLLGLYLVIGALFGLCYLIAAVSDADRPPLVLGVGLLVVGWLPMIGLALSVGRRRITRRTGRQFRPVIVGISAVVIAGFILLILSASVAR